MWYVTKTKSVQSQCPVMRDVSSCRRDGEDALGEPTSSRRARPCLNLEEIDRYASFLQRSAIEKSTTKCYLTGARDYAAFCSDHNLSLDPTPLTLSRYIAFSSHSIASAPKYLTGARHFLKDLYPNFDQNHNHPLVLSTIHGSRKVHADPVVRKLPLRLSHLSMFVDHSLATKSFDDLLFATIMACAFYGCHHQEKHFQSQTVTGLMDVPRASRLLSETPQTFPGDS